MPEIISLGLGLWYMRECNNGHRKNSWLKSLSLRWRRFSLHFLRAARFYCMGNGTMAPFSGSIFLLIFCHPVDTRIHFICNHNSDICICSVVYTTTRFESRIETDDWSSVVLASNTYGTFWMSCLLLPAKLESITIFSHLMFSTVRTYIGALWETVSMCTCVSCTDGRTRAIFPSNRRCGASSSFSSSSSSSLSSSHSWNSRIHFGVYKKTDYVMEMNKLYVLRSVKPSQIVRELLVADVVCSLFFLLSLFSETWIIFSSVVKQKIAGSLAFRHTDFVQALCRIRKQQMYELFWAESDLDGLMRLTFVCVFPLVRFSTGRVGRKTSELHIWPATKHWID